MEEGKKVVWMVFGGCVLRAESYPISKRRLDVRFYSKCGIK